MSQVTVEIDGLRNSRGAVQLCLTRETKAFPDCEHGAQLATIKASERPLRVTFVAVPPGTYAIAAFHDANGNGKLDTLFAIPSEGFAFSRNPRLRPRAPRFGEASFNVEGPTVQRLTIRYIL